MTRRAGRIRRMKKKYKLENFTFNQHMCKIKYNENKEMLKNQRMMIKRQYIKTRKVHLEAKV